MRWFAHFLLLSLLLTPPAHSAGIEAWRIDHRFGRFSQLDFRQNRRGHFKNQTDSMLCGPTSLLNGITKIRNVLGIPPRFGTQDQELAHLVTTVAVESGRPLQSLIQDGLPLDILMKMASRYLKELGIDADVSRILVPPRTDFSQFLNDRDTLILHLTYYKVRDPMAEKVARAERTGGHYTLLDGVAEGSFDKIHVNDPARGSRVLYLDGAVNFGDGTASESWVRAQSDSLFEQSTVLEDAILIRLR